jgi:predicted restriction endonuclease
MTIGEVKSLLGNPSGDDFAKFLRNHARRWAVSNMPHVKCHSCEYDKTTELAHIKPLKHFKDSDLVGETFEGNLVRLCPNHHWEFDHGLHAVNFVINV